MQAIWKKVVFNWSIQQADLKNVVKKWENPYFVQIYIDRMRSIWINLRDPAIIEKVNSGKLRPHLLGFMTHQEMSPEKWEKLNSGQERKR